MRRAAPPAEPPERGRAASLAGPSSVEVFDVSLAYAKEELGLECEESFSDVAGGAPQQYVLITGVRAGGAADRAGVPPGRVIFIDATPVRSLGDVADAIHQAYESGRMALSFAIVVDDELEALAMSLGLEGKGATVRTYSVPVEEGEPLGIEYETIRAPGDADGTICITEVHPGKACHRAGVPVGVVRTVGGVVVRNITDLVRGVSEGISSTGQADFEMLVPRVVPPDPPRGMRWCEAVDSSGGIDWGHIRRYAPADPRRRAWGVKEDFESPWRGVRRPARPPLPRCYGAAVGRRPREASCWILPRRPWDGPRGWRPGIDPPLPDEEEGEFQDEDEMQDEGYEGYTYPAGQEEGDPALWQASSGSLDQQQGQGTPPAEPGPEAGVGSIDDMFGSGGLDGAPPPSPQGPYPDPKLLRKESSSKGQARRN